MNEEEKQIQDALGLLEMYSGYVKAQGSTHFAIYDVWDVNMAGAVKQLNRIVAKAQKKSKARLVLEFILDEMRQFGDKPRPRRIPQS